MTEIPQIAADELEDGLRAGGQLALLDVRSADEFDGWTIDSGAAPLVNIPLTQLREDTQGSLAVLAEKRDLVVVCTRGKASDLAVDELQRSGIRARSLEGGILSWGRLLTASTIEIGSATEIVQLRRESRGCLSYLVFSGGEALVVDPTPDHARYISEAAERGAHIVAVLDTHVHADHLSGARALAEVTGARLYLSHAALERGLRYGDEVSGVGDGDTLSVGSADVHVIALPGHTSDNIGLLLDERALIGGDSLFTDSVARPDLETGDAGAADAAHQLYRTLRTRILSLPDDNVLLPCHYAGGRRAGPVSATLAEVVESVAVLSLEENDFVDAVLSEMPPRPANYEQIIAVNLGAQNSTDVAALEAGANNCAAGPGTTAPAPTDG